MPVKFNQYWSIDYEQVDAYDKFIIKKFIPGINRLGIHAVAGWTILIGGYSEFFLEAVSNNLDLLEKTLRNPKYKELNAELQRYIKSYKTKVLVSTGERDAYSMDIKENTVKFTQAWNVISSRKAEYDKYVRESFYPCLEALSIKIAGEWEVLIGDGPHIICEGRAEEINSIIGNLQSAKFQNAKRQLKQFVENYESRILTFHIHKVSGF